MYICCDRGKNRETIFLALQACFMIAHSSGDLNWTVLYFIFKKSVQKEQL